MGRKPGKARITDSEATLLQYLWESGPATVREIHDKVSKEKDVSYTAVLKTLQIMHEKGLVARDESNRSHTYTATEPAQTSKRSFVDQLLQRVFGGSKSELLLHAVDPNNIKQEDIDELQKAVDQLRAMSQEKK